MLLRNGLLLVSLLVLTGCDENARGLAKEAQAAVDDYRKELNRQAEVERRAYRQQSTITANTNREQAASELTQEKIERARLLAAEAVEGKWSVSQWRTALHAYAEIDVKVQHDVLTAENKAQADLTARLAVLQLSEDRLEALSKVLKELATEPKFLAQAKNMGDFGQSVVTAFDERVCSSLKEELDQQTQAESNAKSSAASLTSSGAAKPKISEATAAENKAAKAAAEIKDKRSKKNCDPTAKKS